MEFDDDFEHEIQRMANEGVDRTIDIPDGLTEDEAVASVIEQYKAETGIEPPEADIRAEVRKLMAGP
jgi:Tat protein secretion system quality control protein TatD with DNase activity